MRIPLIMLENELKLNGEFYTEGILEPTTLFYINYGLNLATKRVNVENIEEILFKAPIPRQGILLIGDFMQYNAKEFQPNNYRDNNYNNNDTIIESLTTLTTVNAANNYRHSCFFEIEQFLLF